MLLSIDTQAHRFRVLESGVMHQKPDKLQKPLISSENMLASFTAVDNRIAEDSLGASKILE